MTSFEICSSRTDIRIIKSSKMRWAGYTAHMELTNVHINVPQKLIYLLTHGAETFSRGRQLCNHSRTFQHFMEPEGSIPCSQEPYTGPYPEPHQYNPHYPILSQIHFNIVHYLSLGIPSGLYQSGFPINILYAFLFSSIRATCSAHLIIT
jgi:hypothetical protein